MRKLLDNTIIRDASVAGYVQVRKYVIDLVVQSTNQPQRLASMRALATRFGVCSTTVQKALKDLVDDGYLTSRIGVGMFTNPDMSWRDSRPDVIDVLIADGRQIYVENYLCQMAAAVCTEITSTGKVLHPIELYQSNQNVLSGVDSRPRGMIWVAPDLASSPRTDAYVEALKIPVVVMAGERPGYSSITYDFEQEGYDVGRCLLEEGRKEPLLIADMEHPTGQIDGVKRAFREAEVYFNSKLIFDRGNDLPRKFSALMEIKGAPDAIYDFAGGISKIESIISEHRVDTISACRLVLTADRVCEWPCWTVSQNYQELARLAFEQLSKHIDQPNLFPVKLKIKRQLKAVKLSTPIKMDDLQHQVKMSSGELVSL